MATSAPLSVIQSSRAPRWREWLDWVVEHRAQLLATIALTAIAAGFVLHAVGEAGTGHEVWRWPLHCSRSSWLPRLSGASSSTTASAWTRLRWSRWSVRSRWMRSWPAR